MTLRSKESKLTLLTFAFHAGAFGVLRAVPLQILCLLNSVFFFFFFFDAPFRHIHAKLQAPANHYPTRAGMKRRGRTRISSQRNPPNPRKLVIPTSSHRKASRHHGLMCGTRKRSYVQTKALNLDPEALGGTGGREFHQLWSPINAIRARNVIRKGIPQRPLLLRPHRQGRSSQLLREMMSRSLSAIHVVPTITTGNFLIYEKSF